MAYAKLWASVTVGGHQEPAVCVCGKTFPCPGKVGDVLEYGKVFSKSFGGLTRKEAVYSTPEFKIQFYDSLIRPVFCVKFTARVVASIEEQEKREEELNSLYSLFLGRFI